MTDAVGPDRNRLHDLAKLVWDEAQVEGQDAQSVTAEDIAEAGPYSVDQISEHLLEEQEDTYVVEEDGAVVRLLSLKV